MSEKHHLSKLSKAIAISVAFASHAVIAQESGQPKAPTIEEVVVTAQKRAQSAQDVPIAISAFGGERLEELGVVDLAGLSSSTPNVNLDNSTPFGGSQSILTAYIRGIGADDFAFNIDPGVGVYVDNVYLARSVGANQSLLDVERIEVLKGPQGTLFGRNTIGGAISIVTSDPADERAGKVDFTYGSDNLVQVRGLVEGPLSDNLTGSMAFSHRERDGYVERVRHPNPAAYNATPSEAFPYVGYGTTDKEGGEDNTSFRAKLKWEGDETTVRFSVDHTEDSSTQASTLIQTTAAVSGGAFGTVTDTGVPRLNSTFPGDGPFLDLDSPALDLNGDGNPLDGIFFGSLYNYCLSVAGPGATAIPPFQGGIAALCGTRGQIGTEMQINTPLFGNPNGMAYYDDSFIHPDIDKSYSDDPNFSDLSASGLSLTIDHDISDTLSLRSITGYRKQDWAAALDLDGSPLNILTVSFEQEQEQFSQEFQLLGNGLADGKLDFVLGAYYFQEDGALNDEVLFPEGLLFVGSDNKFDTNNWAIFGQMEYDITDKLTAIVGGRYTEEEKEFEGGQSDLNGGNYRNFPFCTNPATGFPDPNLVIPPIPGIPTGGLSCDVGVLPAPYWDPVTFRLYEPGTQRQEFDNFSPKVGFQYFANEDTQIYGTYSEGYRTGGWTTRLQNPLPASETEFSEETAKTMELGLKTQLFDNSVQLNMAVFQTDYEDIQLNIQRGVSPTISNAGDAEIFGFEADLMALISENWSFQASLGYLDSEITSIDPRVTIASGANAFQQGIAVDGELPKAPEWQLSFAPRYETYIGENEFALQASISYASDTFNNVERVTSLKRDSYTLVDLIATYRLADYPLTITAGGKNLSDERFLVTGNSNPAAGSLSGTYNRGREWFVSLGYDF